MAFLSVRVVLNLQKSNHDKLDLSIFLLSAASLLLDLASALLLGVGISQAGLVLRVGWSLVLLLIFLRFIFRR